MTKLSPNYFSQQYIVTTTAQQGNGRGEVLQQHYDVTNPQLYHFNYTNNTGNTIAAGSIIALGMVEQGKILPISRLITSQFNSGATLSLGFDQYTVAGTNPMGPEVTTAPNQTLLINATDVHTAAVNSDFQTIGTTNVQGAGYNQPGWALLVATLNGGTMPANGTIDVYLWQMCGNE